jgi:predicted kinase
MIGQLILVRGISGSGKSTFAKMLVETAGFVHLEADKFFVSPSGDYHFNASKLSDAHAWCFEHTFLNLGIGNNVVVSNTFTQGWELMQYINDYNKLTGKFPFVLTSNGAYDNVHGVPDAVLTKQKARFDHDISRFFV